MVVPICPLYRDGEDVGIPRSFLGDTGRQVMIHPQTVVRQGAAAPRYRDASSPLRRDIMLPHLRISYLEPRRREPQGIVHLVAFEAEALSEIAAELASASLAIKAYSDVEALADTDVSDVPGCAVVNTRPAQLAEVNFLADCRCRAGGLPVVVAAAHAEARTVVSTLRAGAADFVETPFRGAEILDAVLVAIGLDRDRREADSRNADLIRRYGTLTPREIQVMALVTDGRLNKQVAWNLGVSEITVKAHRGSLMRKMGAGSLADLVRMADALDVKVADQAED